MQKPYEQEKTKEPEKNAESQKAREITAPPVPAGVPASASTPEPDFNVEPKNDAELIDFDIKEYDDQLCNGVSVRLWVDRKTCCEDPEVNAALIGDNPGVLALQTGLTWYAVIAQVTRMWPDAHVLLVPYLAVGSAFTLAPLGLVVGVKAVDDLPGLEAKSMIFHPRRARHRFSRILQATSEGFGGIFPFLVKESILLICIRQESDCHASNTFTGAGLLLPMGILASGYAIWNSIDPRKKIGWAEQSDNRWWLVNATEFFLKFLLFSRIIQFPIASYTSLSTGITEAIALPLGLLATSLVVPTYQCGAQQKTEGNAVVPRRNNRCNLQPRQICETVLWYSLSANLLYLMEQTIDDLYKKGNTWAVTGILIGYGVCFGIGTLATGLYARENFAEYTKIRVKIEAEQWMKDTKKELSDRILELNFEYLLSEAMQKVRTEIMATIEVGHANLHKIPDFDACEIAIRKLYDKENTNIPPRQPIKKAVGQHQEADKQIGETEVIAVKAQWRAAMEIKLRNELQKKLENQVRVQIALQMQARPALELEDRKVQVRVERPLDPALQTPLLMSAARMQLRSDEGLMPLGSAGQRKIQDEEESISPEREEDRGRGQVASAPAAPIIHAYQRQQSVRAVRTEATLAPPTRSIFSRENCVIA